MDREAIEANTEIVISVITSYGLETIGAVVILIVGWLVSKSVKRFLLAVLDKSDRVDDMLKTLTASAARYLILAITVIAVLGQFGVQTASLVAVLGTIGLAIGLALQGTLSNVAAGVMLLLFRPFTIDDFIDAAGVSGTVKALNLFTTELTTPDNIHIIVPNSLIWGGSVMNYSHHDTRRLELIVGISYDDDIDQALALVNQVLDAEPRVHEEPATLAAVSELADSSVNLIIRAWCDRPDFFALKLDLTKTLKQRFDAEGISIPYPQTVIHQAAAG